MISKIDSMLITKPNLNSKASFKASNSSNNSPVSNSIEFMGYKEVAALQAMNGIKLANTVNFTGNKELNETEKSILGKEEIRIPNILNLEEPINLSYTDTPQQLRKFNSAGLNVNFVDSDGYRSYDISNDLGNEIAILKVKKDAELPEFTYKQGKFMPEITIKAVSDKRHKSIKCLAGSKVVAKDFTLVMPGKYEAEPHKGYKDISFTGKTVITTLNKEPRTVNAVEKYLNASLYEDAIKGDYHDEVVENDPTVVIPAGGFGERFKNITRNAENKPSEFLPTNENFRIIGSTLNAVAGAGLINGTDDDIKYLSQNHEIEESDSIFHTNKYSTDGGAIAEGLTRDIIRNDKDTIILNADIFTNADISRTYHALKSLPNAALVIPFYPVNPQRAKSFGLLGIEKDENGNMQIKSFVEKPKYTKEPPKPSEYSGRGDYDAAMEKWEKVQTAAHPEQKDVYLANPGMYFMSKEASKVLMANGILNPEKTGLGADIMPQIVDMANEGRLIDEQGNALKVYTVPLEAKDGKPAVWDDIGTAEAYLSLIKDVGYETRTNGTDKENKYYGVPEFLLEDFEKNTDPETGIVYDSQRAKEVFESFKQTYGVTEAYGNIFVASNTRTRINAALMDNK